MLFCCSAASLARKLPIVLLFVGSGFLAIAPCRAQDSGNPATGTETEVVEDDPPGSTDPGTDPVPVPVNPLPVGQSKSGGFIVDGGFYQATFTTVDNLGVPEVALQIKKGTFSGGGVTFDTDVLAPDQKVTATPIADNIMFISGKVAVAAAATGGQSPRRQVSGILYKETSDGPLKFKGIGFSNSAKTFEKLRQPAPPANTPTDPCADDPDDMSLT